MSSPLKKRRALVTGGAAGLARGITLSLARDGYETAFTFRPGGTPPGETAALLARENLSARAFPVEFLEAERSVAAALQTVVSEFSPDIVIHAVGPMTIARFARSTMDVYREMIDGNLRSAVLTSAAVLPGMRERRFGRLVFFGLNGSHAAAGARGLSIHAAAKAGLVAFARSLALEEGAAGITVNVVEPGDIRDKYRVRAQARGLTARNPAGRPGTWEDVADAVRFFVRDDADFINGAVLNVNGGLTEVYERNADGP